MYDYPKCIRGINVKIYVYILTGSTALEDALKTIEKDISEDNSIVFKDVNNSLLVFFCIVFLKELLFTTDSVSRETIFDKNLIDYNQLQYINKIRLKALL